ncbi:PVC-type heme-binding CxxCH protein [Limnoglobus roseus]|uniref:Putative beta-propeller-type glycoside hydrolase n=1 Tax=Limnoglobus roseus TaxID=2598579 RepID=A0A5C1ARX9_9BACT|nr:PVC-type heme-binding CxxCH protein [Limnoglobus roseus]QEL20786.1 putative beta-propeller-type glycoside hydrolase [Limnoglobus roseus]
MPRLLLFALCGLFAASPAVAAPPDLKILFLGDRGAHRPKVRFDQLEPIMVKRGIALTYTDSLDALTLDNLNKYDGLVIYANQDRGKPEHVQAILDYVAAGKGFIPLHCGSFCFTNDDNYVKLVGAQFRNHTTGVFRAKTVQPDHPIMRGVQSFESWDETYVHHKHNETNRVVLEVRADRAQEEPWTWVRTHGKGRVFYTAWGHDHRTWSHDGFHTLIERGIRWACGQDLTDAPRYADAPKMTKIQGTDKDFEYGEAKVPFYPAGQRWGTLGEPISKMQKPLSPAASMKHYSVPEGFEVKLFASDEQIGGKPIAQTWDDRGRLWMAVTKDYPNEMRRAGEGRDKIVVCEDADGDGMADTFTVFADKLSIPTSLLCVHGGVLVHQAPHTLFLKDTDGDGKADLRQELVTGWGTNDTHAGPSNLRYGLDNWVYGIVGYSGLNATVAGERLRFGQGIYRFKLEKDGDHKLAVAKFELLRNVNNNAWGVAFNEDGDLFGSTANGCPMVHLPVPNRYYETVRGLNPGPLPNIALSNAYHPVTEKVRAVDWHGGFTAGAGCAVYTARAYPPEYWNRTAFVSDPTGHLTAAFVLQPNGTDYVARYGWNLAAADDEWAAPTDAQVGPDGHVWLIDWYNFIVQHNPTPAGFKTGKGGAYESDLRDKTHGRIYRLVYTGTKPAPPTNLAAAKTDDLVAALKSDNMFWRLHAQRRLVEAGDKAAGESLRKLAADATSSPQTVLHAVWALDGLKAGEGAPVGLDHPSPAVRRAVLQTLPKGAKSAAAIPAAKVLDDADLRVRLAALLALADQPSASAAGPVLAARLAALEAGTDKGLADATLAAAVAHAGPVLADLAAGKHTGGSREVLAAVERVAASYAAKAPTDLGQLLGSLGGTAVSDAIVTGLAGGWPAARPAKLTAADEAAFVKATAATSAASRGRLLRLAAAWGVKGLEAQLADVARGLLAVVADEKATDAARLDAAKQVVEAVPADDRAAGAVVAAVTAKTSPELARGLFEALGTGKAKGVGPAVVAKLGTLPASVRPAALRLVLSRPESAAAFLDAVEKGTVRFDLLDLDQKTALAAHPDKAVAERAAKLLAQGGGLPNSDRQKVIDDYKEVVAKTGDPVNGKKIFLAQCSKCHKHGGEGAQIGPDLTGFAVHPKEETLIHVLDPSRSVEGNYKAYVVRLLDGRTATGLLSAQTKTTVEILDAENRRQTFDRGDLEDDPIESKKSLMPEGFEKLIPKAEFADLLEFLAQKGKYLPVPIDKVATVVTTHGLVSKDGGPAERLVFRDWKPKEFEGVPFVLVDPNGETTRNAVLLNGSGGDVPAAMPKSVTLPCNTAAKVIHFLSGVGVASHPAGEKGTVSLVVRLHYADGKTEDHELKNGVHFADYARRVDVPESKFAFALRQQQVRYLAVAPKRTDAVIKQIELVKGKDSSAPIVMAVTVETP